MLFHKFPIITQLFIVLIGSSEAFQLGLNKNTKPETKCTNPEICSFDWKSRYSSILQYQEEKMYMIMNTSADPCENFFEYACGNWPNVNPMPDEKVVYDTFTKLREEVDLKIRDLLEREQIISVNAEDSQIDGSSSFLLYPNPERCSGMSCVKHFKVKELEESESALDKAKLLYYSCMRDDIVNKRAEKPLIGLLKSLGGWPMIDSSWNPDGFNWVSLLGLLRLYNNEVLIGITVGADGSNSTSNIIQVDQSTLSLTKDYYIEPRYAKFKESYFNMMVKTALLLGANRWTAKTQMRQVLDFETDLSLILITKEKRQYFYQLYKKRKLKHLIYLVPGIDWEHLFEIVFQGQVNDDQDLIVFSLKYFRQLEALISRTPPDVVCNYMIWRFISNRIKYLDSRFDAVRQTFLEDVYGRLKTPDRWSFCVSLVKATLPMSVGRMFVEEFFDVESKIQVASTLISNLKDSFMEMVDEVDWLDDDTKLFARSKIRHMQSRIGYPDYILNNNALNSEYEGLTFDPNRFFENVLETLIYYAEEDIDKLKKPVQKSDWKTPPPDVNAYYSRTRNQILFPAGILQPPFFHKDFPHSLNYGGIGVVIGHEITHGFDDKGRMFDKSGNIHQWWSYRSEQAFKERAECIIEQYSSYRVKSLNLFINGVNTQGENMADSGGLKQAFIAYKKAESSNPKPKQKLTYLNLTDDQLFFLSFAQMWCGSMRPETSILKIKTGSHPPGEYRVLGTLHNSKEFSQVFQCPEGSNMNPSHKCEVW